MVTLLLTNSRLNVNSVVVVVVICFEIFPFVSFLGAFVKSSNHGPLEGVVVE
jgi:hypothetical protein